VKRDHANLCSYNPKHHASDAAIPGGGVKRAHSPESESPSKRAEDRWPRTTGMHAILLCNCRQLVHVLKLHHCPPHVTSYTLLRSVAPSSSIIEDPLSGTDADGQVEDEGTNESRYLGQNSIAAFLSEEARAGEPLVGDDQDVIKKDIMPILGLQISTAPYPFMSPEDMDKIQLHIASALPPSREVLKYVARLDLSTYPLSAQSMSNTQSLQNFSTI
jgi:hypothetical protein